MPYKILCWIPVEPEEPEIYDTMKEALKDLEHYRLMQPENIYAVVKMKSKDPRGDKSGD